MPKQKKIEKNEFIDGNGRRWCFHVTANTVKNLKRVYGFDVRDVLDPVKSTEILDDEDMIIYDIMSLVLLDSFEAANVTPDEMFESMDGDKLSEAMNAFLWGCVFFFPSKKRKVYERTLSLVLTRPNQLESALEKLVNSPQILELMNQPNE